MRRFFSIIFAIVLLLNGFSAFAAGNVTYQKDAGQFIFAPGSAYSPTDLFEEFKSVMPGDSLEQPIRVENKASNKVKVKIWMRALGAHPQSKDFLSKLSLRVEKAEQKGAYMFDAAASESAQLTDWVCLGTLYSGGKVDLNVILDVPVSLTNEYSEQMGYLDWEFKVEEFPIEKEDPKTGDSFSEKYRKIV
jgi:hypothetical protein